jgi:hypothetical protein
VQLGAQGCADDRSFRHELSSHKVVGVHDTWARLRDRPFVSETVRGLGGDSERTAADHEAVGDTTPGSETASAIGEKRG